MIDLTFLSLLGYICMLLTICDNICSIRFFQRLDTEKETIDLVHTNPTETCDLPHRIPTDTPRYHFFLYKHSHEGEYLESVGQSALLQSRVQKIQTQDKFTVFSLCSFF